METTASSPPSILPETERLAYSIQESVDLLGVDLLQRLSTHPAREVTRLSRASWKTACATFGTVVTFKQLARAGNVRSLTSFSLQATAAVSAETFWSLA